MKISAKKVIVLSLAAGIIAGALPASAFTRIARGSEGLGRARVEELANKDLAVLSNNPLYFFKVWGDNLVELFISDEFQEAVFDLKKAGERAGEVRKLVDVASDNTELLSDSLGRYQAALSDFYAQLATLSKADLGEKADKELTDMTARLLTQLRFVDDVRDVFSSEEDTATLNSIDGSLVSSLRFIALNLDNPESFASRITNIVAENSNAATAVRVVRILAKLIQDIAGTEESDEFISSIAAARERLIENIAEAIRQESFSSAKRAAPAVAAFAANDDVVPSISEIVDRLADETLKAELSALLGTN